MLQSTFGFVGLAMHLSLVHAQGMSCTANEDEECCGAVAIMSQTTLCCDGDTPAPITPGGMVADFECCGTNGFINKKTDRCCNDSPVPNAITEGKQCCGTSAAVLGKCCSGEALETDADQCCLGQKITKTADNACCNDRVFYNPMEKKCCGPYLLPLPSGVANEADRACCIDEQTAGRPDRFFPRLFDPLNEACCRGQAQPFKSGLTPESVKCCANRQYASDKERCCRNRLFPTGTSPPRCRGITE